MRAEPAPRLGRRPGNQDTRGAILAAAREAFAARGFAGASVRAIAADAGVDPALIHHYFDSKQQLFLATVQLPLELPQLIERVTAGGMVGLGERLVPDHPHRLGLRAAARSGGGDPYGDGRRRHDPVGTRVLEPGGARTGAAAGRAA